MDADSAWEVFVSYLLIRDHDVTLDVIRSGIVDGSNDGGIDAVYSVLEGTVLETDASILDNPSVAKSYPEGLALELHVIQSKNTNGFSQTAVTKLQSTLTAVLDLSRSLDSLSEEIRAEVLERFDIFRRSLTNLLVRRPRVSISIYVASHGIAEKAPENYAASVRRLEGDIGDLLPVARVTVESIGAEQLWRLYDVRSPETLELECDELLSSGQSYIALAPLSKYIDLICDSDLTVRRHLFDANVRDYQGQVAVNKEISATLRDSNSPEFWWLNNGVTIICDDAHTVGKKIALRNIQIVNGLQTSHTIARWFADELEKSGDGTEAVKHKRLLVRVIVADEDPVRDRIIRATNRQTPVPDASLRATDRIQRQIERYFETRGLFYDRRKGYYRNLGKDPASIISIAYLGQAMYALAYGRPEIARGKPNSLLAEDARYRQAFDETADLAVFYWAAQVLRAVDSHLQSPMSQTRYPERRYLSPVIAFATVTKALGEAPQHWTTLLPLVANDRQFSDMELEEVAATVKGALDKFTDEHSTTPSEATKRQPFTQYLAALLTK
ncbi:AIPR family protein [Pseudonocardia sp. ICBG601]|uniref:AIPR family protein n=1 Tax=Pseudonocardia sp. ICBG601 TaxID=2846759 RepID=UPI001CF609DE|nr:AIPR family protein [Pseudonocardia sp. ICBG601]